MKKYTWVLLPLFFLLAFSLTKTFSLFESEKVNTSSIDIAKWQVEVNGTDISGSTTEFTVNEIHWNSSSNVKSGKIAPGIDGYFDIIIDPNETETSIRYDVTFDFSALDEDQFQITEIKELNNKEIVRTGEFTYSNIISLDEINNDETNTLRVYLEWVNDEANNDKDSELGNFNNHNSINIPVEVEITQYYDSDLLVEYTGA
ncbi:MAG: hypothetical protein IJ568_03705 [Bacilli bacterium]|nr:hypothetical protein [Bacilli bacterium]